MTIGFFVGMLAGMLLLWAIQSAWRQSAMDGWDRIRGNGKHVRRFYDSLEKQRGGQE